MSQGNILIEELLFVPQENEDDLPDPIYISAQVDLAEFDFSVAELQKLRWLVRKLEFALSDEFSRQCAVASVVIEVRSKAVS